MRPLLTSQSHETRTFGFPSPAGSFRRARSCCTGDLEGQKVAVIGLGKCGRSATRLALARGASVLAIDRNEQLVPLEQDPLFAEHVNLQTILGYCDCSVLANVDRVVVSPGVSVEDHGLPKLLASGRQVMSELDFAAEVLPDSIKVLAVTGTNGKSTVTTFAGQMLHYAGIRAFVGGNLGTPLSDAALQYLKPSFAEDIIQVAVVEVSSYQMEIPNNYFRPSVAVILNLTPDHLERHKTMQTYSAMKCRLFSDMKHSKLAVLPTGNQYVMEAFRNYANRCNVAWIGDFPGIKIDMEAQVAHLRIPTTGVVKQLQLGALKAMGAHNYHNTAVAAFTVLGLDVGINVDSINAAVETLSLPPHRMQIVCRDSRGVTWVDDSKATNVEATYAGLTGFKGQKLVILLGGLVKAANSEGSCGFEQLVEPLKYHKGVVTFGASGMMINKTLCDGGLAIPCVRATNLEDAVKQARSMARYGDFIMLCPGCASFDEFKSFEHRGKAFQELALSLA